MKTQDYIFRLYTQGGIADQTVIGLLGNNFESFTVVKATGYWKRVKEESLIAEIIVSGCSAGHKKHVLNGLTSIAKSINTLLSQQCTLVTVESLTARFITDRDF